MKKSVYKTYIFPRETSVFKSILKNCVLAHDMGQPVRVYLAYTSIFYEIEYLEHFRKYHITLVDSSRRVIFSDNYTLSLLFNINRDKRECALSTAFRIALAC